MTTGVSSLPWAPLEAQETLRFKVVYLIGDICDQSGVLRSTKILDEQSEYFGGNHLPSSANREIRRKCKKLKETAQIKPNCAESQKK